MTKLIRIEGIGPANAEKLQGAGINTVEGLLKKGSDPAGREELAGATGISSKRILAWVNMADLFRIKGVSEEYGELLEAAGVDTVPELAQRNPENLHAKLGEVNAEKKLVRRLPALSQVKGWIEQAKNLPRAITY
jgi:predicted flap endonuclease-1-like 5' DNA nuclease